MERTLMKELVTWKNNPDKKPLIIQGVRQCGKSFLMQRFAEQYYNDYVYYRLDKDSQVNDFFEQDLDPRRIIKNLELIRQKSIKPLETLIILDEIQECPRALTALKYFYEDFPEYHIISAGSLLGIAITNGLSFPVGKVEFLTLYPMNFYEFLLSQNALLATQLDESSFNESIWHSFRKELLEQFRDYQFVGGMPEVVQVWLQSKRVEEVNKKQDEILNSYHNDFVKYADAKEYPKISAVWRSIPSQLGKENRKFIFSQVKKGWRAKDLEDALEWLVNAGIIYRVENISKPNYPISAYVDHSYFKIYMCDVGLLRRHADLPSSIVLSNVDIYKEFKGAMAENIIACELKKLYGLINTKNLYYWVAEGSGRAEVDFIVQDDEGWIIPFEVKAGSAKHTRSINQYCLKYQPEISVVTSLDELSERVLPLYAFWKLKDWINRKISRAN